MSMKWEVEGVALNLSLGPAPVGGTVICYNCDKPGHYVTACPAPRKDEIEEIDEEELVVETDDEELGKEDP
jgi:hypothetical protein